MRAGLMNRRITFQRKTIAFNSYNEPYPPTWADAFTVWASAVVESGHESYSAQKLNASEKMVFTIRYQGGINSEMRVKYDRRRQLIVNGLNEIGLETFMPQGAFYAFPKINSTGLDDEKFSQHLLEEEKVAVVPGSAFGAGGVGFVRCSYATRYEKIEKALERIESFVNRCG